MKSDPVPKLAVALAIAALAMAGTLHARANAVETAGRTEKFRFVTYHKDDPSRTPRERVVLETTFTSNSVISVCESRRADGLEVAHVKMKPDGTLLFAAKEQKNSRGLTTVNSRIWTESGSIHAERLRTTGSQSVKSIPLDDGDPVADVGLLYRLRHFPFDKGRSMELLIAAFSQHFVTMQIEQIGDERIRTPAGVFDCHRLKGTVDLVVLKIETVYWITREEPHYLVQYEGRRGILLAPVFVTTLTGIDSLGKADKGPAAEEVDEN